LVVPETVVPVPVLNRTFCSPGCGLLPVRNMTDAEAVELAMSMCGLGQIFRQVD
jgi:hypothetical protein